MNGGRCDDLKAIGVVGLFPESERPANHVASFRWGRASAGATRELILRSGNSVGNHADIQKTMRTEDYFGRKTLYPGNYATIEL